MAHSLKKIIKRLELKQAAIGQALLALRQGNSSKNEVDRDEAADNPDGTAESGARTEPTSRKRTMSAEARKRISAAQKKRWAAVATAKKSAASKSAAKKKAAKRA